MFNLLIRYVFDHCMYTLLCVKKKRFHFPKAKRKSHKTHFVL